MTGRASANGLVFLFAMSVLAGCSSGGGDGDGGAALAGDVLSPGGQAGTLVARIDARDAPAVSASIPSDALAGLAPVPDGSVVALVRLDDFGDVVETLATTATRNGRYSFDLESLDLVLATDLAITTGIGVGFMRALAVQQEQDLDPLSEAELQLLLRQGEGLLPLTLAEVRDLDTSVRLLCETQALAVGPDVETTAELVVDAVLADEGLSGFLVAIAEPGQTTSGPGDVGDYFPSQTGDTWGYAGEIGSGSGSPESYDSALRVTGIDVDGIAAFEAQNVLGAGDDASTFLEESSVAVVNRGDDTLDALTAAVVPYDEFRFPMREGTNWVQYDVQGIAVEDLDLDGIEESADARAESTLVGFEDMSVFGEIAQHVARFDTTVRITIRLSRGQRGVSTLTASEWFAPGLGLVKRSGDIDVRAAGDALEQHVEERLVAYRVGGVGRGVLPPRPLVLDLSVANSDTSNPGRPGLASDGMNYLVVTCRELVPPARLIALRVDGAGLVQQEIDLVELESGECSTPTPSVSFDGTNYLVVYRDSARSDPSFIHGMRISPLGQVLDPGGFQISTVSGTHPVVAFDGIRHLVVWRAYVDTLGDGEIHASFVAPDGTVAGEFVVYAGGGDQYAPALVFGATSYLVVWTDGSYAEADVRGARITPAGDVLDPLGFDVAAGPVGEGYPAVSFDGERFLVAWMLDETATAAGADIAAARFEQDGTPSDLEPIILATGDVSSFPAATFDGTHHVVSWGRYSYDPLSEIRAARVTPLGELLDGPAGEAGITIDTAEAPPTLLTHPAMASSGSGLLIAWLVSAEVYGEAKDLAATVIHSLDR